MSLPSGPQTDIDRTYLQRSARFRNRTLWAIALFGVIAIVFAGIMTFDGVKKSTTSYEQTTGQVIDEGTTQVTVGGRRNRHTETRRTITVEFDTADGSHVDTLQNRTYAVGGVVDVWWDAGAQRAYLAKPGWGAQHFIIGGIGYVGLALCIWGAVALLRRSSRIRRFSPTGRQPEVWVKLNLMELRRTNQRRKSSESNLSLCMRGTVTQSSDAARQAGSTMFLVAPLKAVPREHIGESLALVHVSEGESSSHYIAHDPANGTWFAVRAVSERQFGFFKV